ncbi:MAG: transglycosylase domain-containing protein [Candidatus Latescibacteria bacterium]|jgi:hypothetical protein|nr:transglycosylase domain-containing protein [Candidatus Latescibacterota bacterium]
MAPDRTVRSLRIVQPALVALGVGLSLGALAFVRLSHDLDCALVSLRTESPAPSAAGTLERALAISTDPSLRDVVPAIDLPGNLAARLVPDSGTIAEAKRRSYSALISLRYARGDVLGRYLPLAHMGAVDGVAIQGFHRASEHHFGVPITDLRLGEALLLCDLAASPNDHPLLNGHAAALDRRNRLLARLRDAGRISGSEYEVERRRPLSRGSDHRPIW